MPKDDLSQILDALMAKQIIQSACIDVLLHLVEAILERQGDASVNGLPVREYFQKEKYEHLENILIGFEDIDPGVAAHIQKAVDAHRIKNGDTTE